MKRMLLSTGVGLISTTPLWAATPAAVDHSGDLLICVYILGVIVAILIGLCIYLSLRNRSITADVDSDRNIDLAKLKKIVFRLQNELEDKKEVKETKTLADEISRDAYFQEIVARMISDNMTQHADVHPAQTSSVVEMPPHSTLYLGSPKEDGYFEKMSARPEGCYYIVTDITADTASFDFIRSLFTSIAPYTAIYNKVCQYTGAFRTARDYELVEKGRLQRQSDGKWKVVKKLNIKLID